MGKRLASSWKISKTLIKIRKRLTIDRLIKHGQALAIRGLASGWQAVVFLHQKNIFRSNNKMKFTDIGN